MLYPLRHILSIVIPRKYGESCFFVDVLLQGSSLCVMNFSIKVEQSKHKSM